MDNQGGIVLTTMADNVKSHESDVERHELTDVAHQLSY